MFLKFAKTRQKPFLSSKKMLQSYNRTKDIPREGMPSILIRQAAPPSLLASPLLQTFCA